MIEIKDIKLGMQCYYGGLSTWYPDKIMFEEISYKPPIKCVVSYITGFQIGLKSVEKGNGKPCINVWRYGRWSGDSIFNTKEELIEAIRNDKDKMRELLQQEYKKSEGKLLENLQ